MASTKLTRTPSSAGNRKTYTISMWIKGMGLGSQKTLLDSNFGGGSNEHRLLFKTGSNLEYYDYASSAYQFRYITNRLFRDVNAWYHIVCSVDTTQATASDRVKIYINGVQETSFSTETQPSQNLDTSLNTANLHQFGTKNTGADYFDGSMSHIHFIDGTAYDASAFGETDANGVWKIKTSPSVTYGTNGFFILKDGNSVTDQSGNSNNFTVAGGTLTNTEDSPSNVFATLNPLDGLPSGSGGGSSVVYSNGNTRSDSRNGSGEYPLCRANIFVNSGKWYWEAKVDTSGIGIGAGVMSADANGGDFRGGEWVYGAGFSGHSSGTGFEKYDNSGSITISDVSNSGGVIGYALDLDNGTHSIYLNGVLEGTDTTLPSDNSVYFFPVSVGTFSGGNSWSPISFNFGNGYFGTTAVSTPGTNASGNGIFEYDVPTGYTALSTKGLNL